MEHYTLDQLEEMTKKELIPYANMTYGLNVSAAMNKHDIVQAIQRATQKFAGNAQIAANSQNSLKPGYARIKINKTELNKAGRPIIVSLNGVAASLPVGHEITVPLAYVEILNNAVQYQYEPDPAQENELVRREVHSYPFTVIEMIPAEPKPQLTEE